jgi:hypothetical protein
MVILSIFTLKDAKHNRWGFRLNKGAEEDEEEQEEEEEAEQEKEEEEEEEEEEKVGGSGTGEGEGGGTKSVCITACVVTTVRWR